MAASIGVSSKGTNSREVDNCSKRMDPDTSGSSEVGNFRVKVCWCACNEDENCSNTVVILVVEYSRVKVSWYTKVEIATKAASGTARSTAAVYSDTRMEMSTRDASEMT